MHSVILKMNTPPARSSSASINMSRISITAGEVRIEAELLETATARAIADALPIESHAQTWGDEVYFSVPLHCVLENDARDVIEAGELAFWVEGSCIAIGFGPTPISQADEIRLAARTNIWARAIHDVKKFSAVRAGDPIRVEKI